MFHKPFRVKSNTQVRGSERKLIKQSLAVQYSSLSQADIEVILPHKGLLACVKCEGVKGGGMCTYYIVDKDPVLFKFLGALYPTVYTLWKFPDMLQSVSIWFPVSKKLMAGADLMLPGVAPVERGGASLEGIRKGQRVAINITGNKFPIAMGVALMSHDEMLTSGMQGKGVEILHIYEDKLWALGTKRDVPYQEMPNLQALNLSSSQSDSSDEDDRTSTGAPDPEGMSDKTGTDPSSSATGGASKPTVTSQKVGGVRVRPKKWVSKVKPPPTPSPKEPLDPMSKTTEKKIKRLYKQHHKHVTKQQWNKLMGRDLHTKEECTSASPKLLTAKQMDKDTPGSKVTLPETPTNDDDIVKDHVIQGEGGKIEVTRHTVTESYNVENLESHLVQVGKKSMSEDTALMSEIRAELARATEPVSVVIDLEKESYKVLPVKEAQKQRDNYSIAGNRTVRHTKKVMKEIKDEFDFLEEALRDLVLRYRDTHYVSQTTPLDNSLNEFEMKTYTNGKGGKLYVYMSIRDLSPFGCVVEFCSSKEVYVTQFPSEGCEMDRCDWWQEERTGKSAGILIGDGLQSKKIPPDPDPVIYRKPTSTRWKTDVVLSVFEQRFGPSIKQRLQPVLAKKWFTGSATDDDSLRPYPPLRCSLRFSSKKSNPESLKTSQAIEKYLARQISKDSRVLKYPGETTHPQTEPPKSFTPPPPTTNEDLQFANIPGVRKVGNFILVNEDAPLTDQFIRCLDKEIGSYIQASATPLQPKVTPTQPRVTPIQPKVTPTQPRVTPLQPKVTPTQPRVTPIKPKVTPTQPRATPLQPSVTPTQPRAIPLQPSVTPPVSSDTDSDSEAVKGSVLTKGLVSAPESLGWYHLPRSSHSESDGEMSSNEDTASDDEPTHALDEELTSDPHMDDLLRECFFKAIRSKVKPGDIPLLTSTFYRSYMVEVCPDHLRLDIRKSTYKKLSKFLAAIVCEGVIELGTNGRGAETISKVDFSNDLVRSFRPKLLQSSSPQQSTASPSKNKGIVVEEMWSPSHKLAPIFSPEGFNKKSTLSASNVRETVTSYIKRKNLVCEDNPRMVTLDSALLEAFLKKGAPPLDTLPWPDVFKRIFDEMRPSYRISNGRDPPITRHTLPKVCLSVCRRANKTVTLIDNLSMYGIPPEGVAKTVQKMAASSSSVNSTMDGSNQVLVQGNQIKTIVKLLEVEYGLPLKYIEAIDKVKPPKTKTKAK